MNGTGPFISLAITKEYASRIKPKNVFYLFYEGNDLRDMMYEEKTFLKKYLNDDFSQNFYPDIDDCCVKILRIVKNPELYQKILNKHRKFLASNFCIDEHIIELNKLLEKY